uniref:F-box domain-containing protein n=1 Tax=Moniliophthora roreri TaxID=221103 RepID=A0A0W0FKE1_MONRR
MVNEMTKPSDYSHFHVSQLQYLAIHSDTAVFDWMLDDSLISRTPSNLESLTIDEGSFTLPKLCQFLERNATTLTYFGLNPYGPLPSAFPSMAGLKGVSIQRMQVDSDEPALQWFLHEFSQDHRWKLFIIRVIEKFTAITEIMIDFDLTDPSANSQYGKRIRTNFEARVRNFIPDSFVGRKRVTVYWGILNMVSIV